MAVEVLKLEDWISSSDKYPERAAEITDDVREAAVVLVSKLNLLLAQLGIQNVVVSSGFRPASVNSKTPNAAKRSAHMSGKAIDLEDKDGSIKALIQANPELLRNFGLFMEDAASTPTWCHIDCVIRADRPSRTFKP